MKPPLLLIGHGAHDDTGAAEFGRFVHRLRCRLDQVAADVSGGFVAKGRPSLNDSVASLLARGHHRLVTVPLALGDNGDIPAEIARAQVMHPTLSCDLARPLDASPQVLGLMAERLADALAEMPRLASVTVGDEHGEAAWEPISPAETAVVLVGHGSPDTAANAEVHRVSRLFWETHAADLLTVETAYVSDAPPSVAQGIERCRRLGAKRVVVLPYLLFAGGVLERIWAEALAYAAGHIDLDVRCAEVIGDCEGLADLIIDRYEQALHAASPWPSHQNGTPFALRTPFNADTAAFAPDAPFDADSAAFDADTLFEADTAFKADTAFDADTAFKADTAFESDTAFEANTAAFGADTAAFRAVEGELPAFTDPVEAVLDPADEPLSLEELDSLPAPEILEDPTAPVLRGDDVLREDDPLRGDDVLGGDEPPVRRLTRDQPTLAEGLV
ncbi:sirohydrochlorin chelatase [Sphaerisporangium rhizosphaerae]|uniref:Sirohydrochlorin chelatase n=1 Tax=Sphaerisporangium rhizosphaerae TaxID=2269375 RepID=A0ABW2PEC2_9ACTN